MYCIVGSKTQASSTECMHILILIPHHMRRSAEIYTHVSFRCTTEADDSWDHHLHVPSPNTSSKETKHVWHAECTVSTQATPFPEHHHHALINLRYSCQPHWMHRVQMLSPRSPTVHDLFQVILEVGHHAVANSDNFSKLRIQQSCDFSCIVGNCGRQDLALCISVRLLSENSTTTAQTLTGIGFDSDERTDRRKDLAVSGNNTRYYDFLQRGTGPNHALPDTFNFRSIGSIMDWQFVFIWTDTKDWHLGQ